jgi:hypothetical protein
MDTNPNRFAKKATTIMAAAKIKIFITLYISVPLPVGSSCPVVARRAKSEAASEAQFNPAGISTGFAPKINIGTNVLKLDLVRFKVQGF